MEERLAIDKRRASNDSPKLCNARLEKKLLHIHRGAALSSTQGHPRGQLVPRKPTQASVLLAQGSRMEECVALATLPFFAFRSRGDRDRTTSGGQTDCGLRRNLSPSPVTQSRSRTEAVLAHPSTALRSAGMSARRSVGSSESRSAKLTPAAETLRGLQRAQCRAEMC